MKLARTEARIFLATSCLSFIAFFLMFAVCMPLIYEHRPISSRLSPEYVANFLYSMSLYFVLAGVLSALVYRFVKPMKVEGKIFIVTFITIYWAIVGAVSTTSLYWGNVSFQPLNPIGVALSFFWGSYIGILAFFFISFYLLIISGSVVVMYEMYKLAMRMHYHPQVDEENRQLEPRKPFSFLMNRKFRIFISVYLLVFFLFFFSASMLSTFFRGHPLIDLGRLDWASFFLCFSSFFLHL